MNTLELERNVGVNRTLIVDATMKITGLVEWTRAVTLVMANSAYVLVPRADGSQIRSMTEAVPNPLVVCLNKHVVQAYRDRGTREYVSRKMILQRDNFTCKYCGKYGDTIDHILPRSRGGENTWANLCAACKKCNSKKRNLTPAEAGMPEPVFPREGEYSRELALQNVLYSVLGTLGGYDHEAVSA